MKGRLFGAGHRLAHPMPALASVGGSNGRRGRRTLQVWDPILPAVTIALLAVGLVAVYSASIAYAESRTGNPHYYLVRHAVSVLLALLAGGVVTQLPIALWRSLAGYLMVGALVLLALVLVPGIGHEVNGSARWIRLGPQQIQPSELAKLAYVLYAARLLARTEHAPQSRLQVALLGPLTVLLVTAVLLLLEPDFGAAAVLAGTLAGMLLMAGLNWLHFAILGAGGAACLGSLVLTSPYRLARLTAFLDPWADPYGDGFQLTQALIAFGRGGWHGVGLGESMQKLFYLPEAHTDFLLAIVAEEGGLIVVLLLIAAFGALTWRLFAIARLAMARGQRFAGLLAYGIGLLLSLQVFFNMGVNMGVLPTKGLTLPLLSYGGNSLLVSVVGIALVLRIDHELRRKA